MAGAASRIEYVSDNGTHYYKLNPNWQNTIAGNDPSSATIPLPKGTECRYRMMMDPATGREWKIVVGDPTSAFWTDAPGTAYGASITVPVGETITGTLIAGAIGERRLFRS